ncbi:stage III sporulation protein AF [Paenibacillus eucommiae]|uniref:Stage III sporulation protein AF n=1 Tax=Paenibacillus eucommiae TaxID=1355755 RepID=A0ABS4IN95_9BACL|nr:stage III sporulation protein AF [Paenibacillus eucommiae]MBP1989047.1 stage III sporulation protein AF [Paenibacillus eucommiae]
MDWLAGWLRTIIMVILLATFVDLLLPSNTMHRYVKTVMSLFILLTLLSPVLELFQKNWDVEQMMTAAEQKQYNAANQASNGRKGGMKSLEAIIQDAERLKAIGEKQSLELLQKQIETVMMQDLQQQTDLVVDKAQVAAKLDNNGKPIVTDVWVTLHEIDRESAAQKPEEAEDIAAIASIRPIEPIRIRRDSDELVSAGKRGESGGAPGKLSLPLEQERQRLVQRISRDWQVHAGQIEVQIQAGLKE